MADQCGCFCISVRQSKTWKILVLDRYGTILTPICQLKFVASFLTVLIALTTLYNNLFILLFDMYKAKALERDREGMEWKFYAWWLNSSSFVPKSLISLVFHMVNPLPRSYFSFGGYRWLIIALHFCPKISKVGTSLHSLLCFDHNY